jgi:hypothetical protein
MSQRKNAIVLPEPTMARLKAMVAGGSFLTIEEAAVHLIFLGAQSWDCKAVPTTVPEPEAGPPPKKKKSLEALDILDGL